MRPKPEDYIPYHAAYINLVPESDVLEALTNNHRQTLAAIRSIPLDKADHAYAPGKWTIKQVLNHILDAERIFAYRALRFARGDNQLLSGFEENDYAEKANLGHTTLGVLAEEFDVVRKSNVLLFWQLSEKELQLRGKLPAGEITVLSLGYIMCGHAQHHMNVIHEKYLQP